MRCICIHCGKSFSSNPRVKNQRYCSHRGCQRARRARWQREKMVNDPDYQDNQRRCQKEWLSTHSGYWRDYRAKHPEYVKRNRLLQIRRNAKRSKDRLVKMIAKMDELNPSRGKVFRLIPQGGRLIAKMDELIVKLIPVEGVMKL